RGTVRTVSGYLRRKIVPYQGLEKLLDLYYRSLIEGRQPPIPSALAIATARTEEEIFATAGRLHLDSSNRRSRQANVSRSETVLVTGANGYLGREVCRQLVERGFPVRALVRPVSPLTSLESLGVELVFGDVRDREAVAGAAAGAGVIVHLAASLRGSA